MKESIFTELEQINFLTNFVGATVSMSMQILAKPILLLGQKKKRTTVISN